MLRSSPWARGGDDFGHLPLTSCPFHVSVEARHICLLSRPAMTWLITCRSRAVSVSKRERNSARRLPGAAPDPVFLQRRADCVEQILVAERLVQELDGARLHRPHRHRNVAMAGDED